MKRIIISIICFVVTFFVIYSYLNFVTNDAAIGTVFRYRYLGNHNERDMIVVSNTRWTYQYADLYDPEYSGIRGSFKPIDRMYYKIIKDPRKDKK